MSEPISLPAIEISADAYEDEDSGRTSFFPKIRAYSNGYSLGMLALTSFEGLFLLRRAIDDFISTNNIIDNMKEKNSEEQVAPKYAAVIEEYLLANGYTPMGGGDSTQAKNEKKLSGDNHRACGHGRP